jgi:hypothetical protein
MAEIKSLYVSSASPKRRRLMTTAEQQRRAAGNEGVGASGHRQGSAGDYRRANPVMWDLLLLSCSGRRGTGCGPERQATRRGESAAAHRTRTPIPSFPSLRTHTHTRVQQHTHTHTAFRRLPTAAERKTSAFSKAGKQLKTSNTRRRPGMQHNKMKIKWVRWTFNAQWRHVVNLDFGQLVTDPAQSRWDFIRL